MVTTVLVGLGVFLALVVVLMVWLAFGSRRRPARRGSRGGWSAGSYGHSSHGGSSDDNSDRGDSGGGWWGGGDSGGGGGDSGGSSGGGGGGGD